MKCNRCGVETDVFYNVNEGLILCPDCATLSVSQLSFEGLLEMSETEVLEADGDVIAVDDEAIDFEEIGRSLNEVTVMGENSEEKFYCAFQQKNVVMSDGANCDVDADEDPVDGIYDSGRSYGACDCSDCRFREAYREEENYES